MRKAQLVTIGTEITSGEVINSNASWVSLQLEDRGVRVMSHLTVRDLADEILQALKNTTDSDLVIVTGGLGPTSDDMTRASVAQFAGQPLEFDEKVWKDLVRLYEERGLPLREAHRHQCHFPRGARRLANPAGTALGFSFTLAGRLYFVLPGPPRELQAMWQQNVEAELQRLLPPTSWRWRRWTCLGAPESEIAELVEKALAGCDLEIGYRAAVPYVKVKVYVDEAEPEHQSRVAAVAQALQPFVVGEGGDDLADEFLRLWPLPHLHVHDALTGAHLTQRLFARRRGEHPRLDVRVSESATAAVSDGLCVTAEGEDLVVTLNVGAKTVCERLRLPYKLALRSERGRLSAAEWALWISVRALRSKSS